MATLPKFTLAKNAGKGRWELVDDASGRVVESFATKEAATGGGALEKAVGRAGGSVRIRKQDGTFEEERTFPRSADPRSSKG